MKKLYLTVLILFVSFAFLNAADVYIKQKVHTDPITIMGQSQPAKDEISEMWIGDKRFAYHREDSSQIVDLSKNIMYMINHARKTYIEATLPFDIADYMPEQMAQMMQSMMGGIKIEVTPTGQTKTIGSWKCDGYNVTMDMMMMQMNMEIWATADVPFDWKKFSQEGMGNFMKAQMRLDDSTIKEFEKIKGFMIYTETKGKMMGAEMRSTSEVVEISKKPAGDAAYSVPEGYTKQEKLSMEDMRR